jgi:hypothetical protein
MDELKIKDDDYVPQTFGVGPIPRFLASRELGLVGKRPMTYLAPKEPSFEDVIRKEPTFESIFRNPEESLSLEQVLISPGNFSTPN